MNDYLIEFQGLLIALSLGLLIGLERGWSERGGDEGSRVAGIRTFGLISLLGALWQLQGGNAPAWLVAGPFVAFALVLTASTYLEIKQKGDYSITTAVAALITFVLGALAMSPHVKLAAATAVIVTILLGLKPVLHGALRKLEPVELAAILQLLLISCVMLPVLPDRAVDPWGAFNPYEVWWMVVAISAISFAGYFAIKLAGPSRGILLTGLFAGLVSSTAATLSMSRMARTQPAWQRLLAAGVIIASTTMFPRILLIVGLLQPALIKPLLWPLLLMSACGYATAWGLTRKTPEVQVSGRVELKNPFEFGMALRFGGLLAAIMVLTRLLKDTYGHIGVFLMAGISALSDVDAITLSLARLSPSHYSVDLASLAIVFAALVNTLVKGGLTIAIAGGAMARIVAATFIAMIALGLAVAWADGAISQPLIAL
ncbi:MgtC/SapB family protein [Methylococcus sp. EFPC2]|uniref:MgtC/SapB family protein n=1 Tax=Methylococcus sp. EFPC2 TaxID=2812648 RepID=UPI00196762AE|nr:MgtC/SapB family protein [Methylococcus sp. EFPC2]QSA97912.1 MgtC/SapB family protein [Methylococcus sp. EFPC2]